MWKEELKDLRKKNKLTQQELADALGLEVRQIKRYESGESTIPRYMELAVKYLFLHGEQPSHKLPIDHLLDETEPKLREWSDRREQLSESGRGGVHDYKGEETWLEDGRKVLTSAIALSAGLSREIRELAGYDKRQSFRITYAEIERLSGYVFQLCSLSQTYGIYKESAGWRRGRGEVFRMSDWEREFQRPKTAEDEPTQSESVAVPE